MKPEAGYWKHDTSWLRFTPKTGLVISQSIAIALGVDFSYLICRDKLGESVRVNDFKKYAEKQTKYLIEFNSFSQSLYD